MPTFAELVEQADRAVQRALGGDSMTYSPANAAPFPVTGIFDPRYVLAKGDAHAGVEATAPAVFLRLDDLLPSDPEAEDRATIAVRGNIYSVREARPDGIGGVVLVLRRVT